MPPKQKLTEEALSERMGRVFTGMLIVIKSGKAKQCGSKPEKGVFSTAYFYADETGR